MKIYIIKQDPKEERFENSRYELNSRQIILGNIIHSDFIVVSRRVSTSSNNCSIFRLYFKIMFRPTGQIEFSRCPSSSNVLFWLYPLCNCTKIFIPFPIIMIALRVVIEQLSAKNCKKVDQNLDVEEDEYMIVEQPESNTSKTTSLKKGKTSKKRGPVKSRNRPGIESDDEVAIEDVCKSSETFLTLKKGGNAGTRSKMVSNNTFKNDSLLSTKQRVPRSFKKSKIPVREKKGRATVSHPREPRMKKNKPAEVTERRKSSQKGYDEETYQALGVQATMNQTEFVRSNGAGDDKLSDDFVVEQEGDEEMSAESGVEANERKGGKDSEGLSGGNKKKGLTQVSNAGSKCRKMAVRRRSQQSMTGISVAKKQAKVTSEVNNGFKLKPRAVQHKPLVKRKASTAKTRAQRNTRQNENNVGSSSELSGETGPIKAVEITVENDGKVCDDTLRSFVGERMLEPETFSVEENSNLTIKAPKRRGERSTSAGSQLI